MQSKKRVNSYQATVLRGAVVEIKSFSLNFPMSHVVTEHVNVNPLEDCGTMKAYQSRGMPSFFAPALKKHVRRVSQHNGHHVDDKNYYTITITMILSFYHAVGTSRPCIAPLNEWPCESCWCRRYSASR